MTDDKHNVTYNDSKATIWQAYKALKEGAAGDAVPAAAPMAKAAAPTQDALGQLSAVRQKIQADLTAVADALTAENEQLRTLRIEIGQKRLELERLYAIKVEAETLEEIKRRQAAEQVSAQEAAQARERARLREEEEFRYQIKTRQARLDDELAATRTAAERELTAERTALKQEAAKLEALRKQYERAPAELQAAVLKAERSAAERLAEQLKYEQQLYNQQLASYKETVSRQDKDIAALRAQLQKALEQIKDMAVGALQGQDKPTQKA